VSGGDFIGGEKAASLQSFQKQEAGTMKPGLHSPHRPTDSLGNLLVILPVFVKQHEHFAVFHSQIIDSGPNLGSQLNGIIRRAVVGRFVEVIREFGASRTATDPCPAAVHGDTQHPRPQRAFAIPPRQTAEHAEEDFLCHVLGVVTVGKQSLADGEDVRLETLDQLPASSRVVGQATADERGVGGHDDLS